MKLNDEDMKLNDENETKIQYEHRVFTDGK